MVGLFAFFYAMLHFTTYFVLDQSMMFSGLWEDVVKRPYITMGFSAFVLMIPLALTSTQGWIRRLGGRQWNLLHRLVYASAILGVIHYWWKVKIDTTYPMYYAIVVGVLLQRAALARARETADCSRPSTCARRARDRPPRRHPPRTDAGGRRPLFRRHALLQLLEPVEDHLNLGSGRRSGHARLSWIDEGHELAGGRDVVVPHVA